MRKIIVRAPNHLGDLLMAQPAIRGLVESLPDITVGLLLPDWAKVIFGGIQNLRTYPLKPEFLHGGNAIFNQRDYIKGEKFENGVLLTPSFSSALVFYLSGVKNRYGYMGDGRNFLLNHAVDPKAVHSKHRSKQYAHLVEYFTGMDVMFDKPRIKITEEKSVSVEVELNEYGIDNDMPYAVIAPQAVAESRRWGSDNYRDLSNRLVDKNKCKIVLVGTAVEFAAGEQIREGSTNMINLCGKTDIETAAGVLSKAKLFIGNDSGLAHLAAAVNIPLVVLSGADRPSETSPLSDNKTVIIRENLDCISCVKNICPLKGEAFMRCMKEISVDEVFAATQSKIKN